MDNRVIKILCVDDEVEILNALKRLFRQAKYKVFSVSNGHDALAILADSEVDIIISDVCMPQMNGVDFLGHVYQNWPETKRIVLTGFANIEDTLRMINDCDIYRYFNKPWNKDELLQAVNNAAEQKWLSEDNQRLLKLTKEQNKQLLQLNKQLDNKVKVSNERLDQTTSLLKDEIVNEKKLMQEKAGADKANQAKSRFLATMSHEIRSPLNSIIVMNNLLLETNLNDQQRSYSEQAHQAGQMLLSLVNDILDFSKIESGQISLNLQWFDLEKMINSTYKILSGQALSKHIDFECFCDSSVFGEFNGDEVRLKQIVLNLVANAIKFTEQGYVKVKVFRESVSENLIIEVQDSGIGIAQSQQKYIFNEFAQVEDDESRRFGGTGLGLSIVKRLVSLMKGVISLSSEVNQGSTFTIALPLPYQQALSNSPQSIYGQPGQDNNADLLTDRKSLLSVLSEVDILVVEDSETNIAVINALLSGQNFSLTYARNGKEAVKLATEQKFSVILMDLSMPIMNGLDATLWIRNNPNVNRKTPVIAMTANAFSEDKIRCFQVGMDDYLTKPIEIDSFYACLYKHLSNHITDECLSSGNGPFPLGEPNTRQTTTEENINIKPCNNLNAVNIFSSAILDKLIKDISTEVFPKIWQVYQEETSERIDKMQDLLKQESWNDIIDQAHALKSSSGSFGLIELQDIAKNIEHAKTLQERPILVKNVERLVIIYKASVEALEAHLSKLEVNYDHIE